MADGYISQIKTPDNKVYLLKDSEKTDEKVKQSSNTEDKEFPIILKNTNNTTNETTGVKYAGGVTVNPSEKTVTATEFIGNLKINKLIPIDEITYPAYTCAADNEAKAVLFFGKVTISDTSIWQAPWTVRYRVYVSTTEANTQGWYDCNFTVSGSTVNYYIDNNFYSGSYRPIYHHRLIYPKNGYSSYGAYFGVRIQSSRSPTSLARVLKVELLETTGCTVELLPSIKRFDEVYITTNNVAAGTIWYNTDYNGTDAGLRVSGNANTNDTGYYILTNGFRMTAGANKVSRYTLFGRIYDGTYESFTITSNTAATTKEKNPHGFLPDGKIYWNSAGGEYTGAVALSAYEQYHSIDYRYTFNITTTGIPANTPTYVKWTYADGLLYLADEWFATALPTTEDGFIYQRIGSNYYGTADYRGSLLLNNPYYIYTNGSLRVWQPENRGISNITRSGTTFTVTRDDGSTFTFTQQDNSGITSVTIGATSPVQSSTSTAQTGSSASTTISLKDAYGDTKNPYGAKAKNLVLAGPSSGSNAAPAFRALVAADIPDLSWNKITSDKPTTLAGYGITDAATSTHNHDDDYVKITGDTMTGNLIVPAVRMANTYYGISFGRTTATPVETILHTGIKWVSGSHMPVIHITGYAYGLQSPVEFKIGFYIYNDKIGYCGATNMGSWQPNIYLYKDTRNNTNYVAVGLAGSCYFLQLSVDVQDEMGKFNKISTDSSDWSWEFLTTTGTIPQTDDGTSCCSVPYKASIFSAKNAQITTTANAIAYYTNVTGTFGSKASANGALYATSVNGALQWGTLPLAQGGTGATTAANARTNLGLGTMAVETAANYAKLASPALTGTPTAPTAANGTSTTQIATTEFVNNTLSYVNAMRFKGTLGTGGTITALPASHEAGDTYRVVTAGTWAGKYCEEGTLIICVKDGTAAADADWTSVETNEDGAVIGPSSSTDNHIVTFDGNTGRIIQDSAKAFSTATPSSSSTDAQIPTAKAVWAAIDALDVTAAGGGTGVYISKISQTNGKISATTSTTTSTFTITDGTTAGPTVKISINGIDSTNAPAIPSASASNSGIVTTAAQTFAGAKTFNNDITLKGDVIFPSANSTLDWNDGTYRQRIAVTDDSTANTAVFTFQQSSNSGSSYTNLFTILDDKSVATERYNYTVNDDIKAYTQYNTTDNSIDFIFA